MDDIGFFDSLPYSHRGGIWPEAARKTSERDDTASDAGDRPPSSLSGLEAASKSEPALSPGLELSAQDVLDSSETEGTYSDALDSHKPQARRRTWFTTVSKGTNPADLAAAESLPTSPPRGRFTESEPALQPPATRSRSNPSRGLEPSADTYRAGASSSYESNRNLTSSMSGRSATASPPLPPKDYQPFLTADDASSVASLGETAPMSPSLSRTSSARSTNSHSTPTSPSFFSTLKSRSGGADRATLGNQAKEAMRKLTVNWNSLKRNSQEGSNVRDTSFEDNWDAGVPGSRASAAAPGVREARTDSQLLDGNEAERTPIATPGFPQAEPSAEAIPIPDMGKSKARTLSIGSASSLAGSIGASSSPGSSRDSASGSTSMKSAAPPVISRNTSGASSGPQAGDLPADVLAPAPIRTQPNQAKTMMIPGIHASHKGEVMSMGYVAPSPSPPTLENKMKASPAIQSVYKLWKNPANGANGASTSDSESAVPLNGHAESAPSLETSTPSSQNTPAPQFTRPAPPPLPPRTQTAKRAPYPEQTLSEDTVTPSAASEALKSIATKDAQLSQLDSRPPLQQAQALDDPVETVAPSIDQGTSIDPVGTSNIVTPTSSSTTTPSTPQSSASSFRPPLPPRRPAPSSASSD